MASVCKFRCQPLQAVLALFLVHIYEGFPVYAHNSYFSAGLTSVSKLTGSADLVGNHTSHSKPPVTGFLYFTLTLPPGFNVTGGGVYRGVLPNTSAAPVVNLSPALVAGNTGMVNMSGDVYSGISQLVGAHYLQISSTSPNDTLRGQLYQVLKAEEGSVVANLTGVNQTATGTGVLYIEENEDKKTSNVSVDLVIRPVPALTGIITEVVIEEADTGELYLDLTPGVNLTKLNLYKQSSGMLVLPTDNVSHVEEEAAGHKLVIKTKNGAVTGALESTLTYINATGTGKPDSGARASTSPFALLLSLTSAVALYLVFV